jgi:DNA-binding GntR family transcriptional regulator
MNIKPSTRAKPVRSQTIAPIHRAETLTESVYNRLCAAIMEGLFLPGAKISTREIAADLGVSPTPAREALLRLVGASVLEMPNARTVVVPTLTAVRYDEIVQIRVRLEGLAAEAALQNLAAADIEQLELFQLGISAGYGARDYRQILTNNRAFHFHIYTKSHMPVLISMIENCWLLMGPSLNLLYPSFLQGGSGPKNHQRALVAIRRRDAHALRAAMEQDILDGAVYLRPALAASKAVA